MRRLRMFGGLLLALCGAFWTFMLYGFGMMAEMGNPDIVGAAREVAI